jgi:hypothetical protein
MTTFHADHTSLPATCSPRCNPGAHDLIACLTPLPKWTPTTMRRKTYWPDVTILRPRSDEDGEVASDRECDRAGDAYFAPRGGA